MTRLQNEQAYQNANQHTLLRKARSVVNQELERVPFFSVDSVARWEALPRFDDREVQVGRVLGRGGFCVVREIVGLRLLPPVVGTKYNTKTNNAKGGLTKKSDKEQQQQQQRIYEGDNGSVCSTKSKSKNHIRTLSLDMRGGTNDSNFLNFSRKSSNCNSKGTEATAIIIGAEEEESAKSSNVSHDGTGGAGLIGWVTGAGSKNKPFASYPELEFGADQSDGKPSAATAAGVLTREQLARKMWCLGTKRKGAPMYVMKKVEPDLFHNIGNRVSYLKGTIDLALETHFLASLSHEHILKIKAISRCSPFQHVGGYFIILEALPEILSKRLTKWMHQYRATKGITGVITGGRRKANQLLVERLLVAYDVADAMNYLHQRNIVFRDLKPDNIGFNPQGALKLFDFGLAKVLRPEDEAEDGLYNMTGLTGAIRYMAPEVGLQQPYNLKADVYSWSMLMWYIMALEPPMGMYTPKMFIQRVFAMGYRPMTKDKWPAKLNHLMKKSWSEFIEDRPSFQDIMIVLKSEVASIDEHASFLMAASSLTEVDGGCNDDGAMNNDGVAQESGVSSPVSSSPSVSSTPPDDDDDSHDEKQKNYSHDQAERQQQQQVLDDTHIDHELKKFVGDSLRKENSTNTTLTNTSAGKLCDSPLVETADEVAYHDLRQQQHRHRGNDQSNEFLLEDENIVKAKLDSQQQLHLHRQHHHDVQGKPRSLEGHGHQQGAFDHPLRV